MRFLVAEIFSCFHTFVFFLTFVSDTAAVMVSLRTSSVANLDRTVSVHPFWEVRLAMTLTSFVALALRHWCDTVGYSNSMGRYSDCAVPDRRLIFSSCICFEHHMDSQRG